MTNNQRSALARGASTVEFALLVAALVLAGGSSFRALGHGVARASAGATSALDGSIRDVRVARLPPAVAEAARP